jgi:hypothetical protein
MRCNLLRYMSGTRTCRYTNTVVAFAGGCNGHVNTRRRHANPILVSAVAEHLTPQLSTCLYL